MKKPDLFEGLILNNKENIELLKNKITSDVEDIFDRAEQRENIEQEASQNIAKFFGSLTQPYFYIVQFLAKIIYFSIAQIWLHNDIEHLSKFQNFCKWALVENYNVYNMSNSLSQNTKTNYFIQASKNINRELEFYKLPPNSRDFLELSWHLPLAILFLGLAILFGLLVVFVPIFLLSLLIRT